MATAPLLIMVRTAAAVPVIVPIVAEAASLVVEMVSVPSCAFGLEPVLSQSAWFRPHNRSEDIGDIPDDVARRPHHHPHELAGHAELVAALAGEDAEGQRDE